MGIAIEVGYNQSNKGQNQSKGNVTGNVRTNGNKPKNIIDKN